MRSIGQGASSAKRFCGVMNMPPPPKPNAYQGHNKALMKATKTVAEETMNSAAIEIHNLSHEENEITKYGVLYSHRNDPDPEMIPNPEMIPKSTPK